MAYTTINNPELYFQTELFTGNASTGHAQTLDGSEDMQPDMVWFKNRDATDVPSIYDAVRGATERITPHDTANESDQVNGLQSFDSDGFTVGGNAECNESGEKIVAWCWKANGSGSSNTDGSINTTATSANTTAGFSIIQFTGSGANATIGHGLGAAVKCFIVKKIDGGAAYGAKMMHLGVGGLGNTHAYKLDETAVPQDYDGYWNDTSPTATLISLGASDHVNSTNENICYAWAPIQGFSKFGTYVGNGNADGPFVYTGFRPAWIMTKNTETAKNWQIYDNKRSGHNPDNDQLFANTTAVEDTGENALDILSNGFKIRVNSDPVNLNTDVIAYMAFAEQPFVNSNGVPANAR